MERTLAWAPLDQMGPRLSAARQLCLRMAEGRQELVSRPALPLLRELCHTAALLDEVSQRMAAGVARLRAVTPWQRT